MPKVFNLKLIKKVTVKEVETVMEAHSSWAKVINEQDLYGAKYDSVNTILLLCHKNRPMKFFVPVEFAKDHFMVIGDGVKDEMGQKLEQYINAPETYLR